MEGIGQRMCGMKLCKHCGLVKPLSAFHKARDAKDGHQSKCAMCAKLYQVVWRNAHEESNRVYEARRNATPERATARKEHHKNSYAANRAIVIARTKAYRLAHPELSRKACNEWRKRNLHVVAEFQRRYRAQKLQAYPQWADPVAIEEIYEHCRVVTIVSGEPHHVDHIVPLNHPLVCGLHNQFNLQILSGPENCSKGNRYWPDMPD